MKSGDSSGRPSEPRSSRAPRSRIRGLICIGVATLVFASWRIDARAQLLTGPKPFNVEAQALEKALLEYSKQAGVQIVAPTDSLAEYQASAVVGDFEPAEALRRILSSTPLRFEFAAENTVYIIDASSDSGDKRFAALAPKMDENQPIANLSPTVNRDALTGAGASFLDRDQIIVTGTRLRNVAFTGIAPVQIINPDKAGLGGQFGAEDFIRSSALATGSFQINQQLGATGPGGRIANGGAGVNGLSLRGLGTQRSLIVLDGRRLAPAGVQGRIGAVDLNVFPSNALARVEIVKDGTSSVYGADAIAGVVNGVTKKNYDGATIEFAGNIPVAGNGERFFAFGDIGKTFDRGWISVAGEFSQQMRLRNSERDFLRCSEDFLFDPDTGARVDLREPDGAVKCRDHNPNGVFFSADFFAGTFQPDPSGALVGLVGDTTRAFLPEWARVGNFQLTDSADERASYAPRRETSEAYQNADAISPLRRFGLFLNGEYEVSDSINAYGNILFNRRESEFDSWFFLFQGLSADHPNNIVSAGLQAASLGGSTGAIQYQLVRPFNNAQTVNYYSAVAGLKGEFGDSILSGWSWDAFISYGRSQGEYSQDFLYKDRLNAISLGSTACDPSFLIAALNPANFCDGVDIPVLDTRFLVDQNWTDQELAFLEGREIGRTTYSQWVVEGAVTGDLFDLPAGSVEAVFGASFRRDEIDDRPGPNAAAGNYHLASTAGRTFGSERVREIFGEIGVPLISERLMAYNVAAVGSARYTSYGVSGDKATYKGGVNWSFTPALALRGSYGTSFRGPNLYELYLADQVAFQFVDDPCQEFADETNPLFIANCSSLGIPNDFRPTSFDSEVTSGGAILPDGTTTINPETARTYTVGLLFTPADLGLAIALDYFHIEVNDEIDTLGAQAILDACYGLDDFASNAFCTLIERNGATTTDGTQPFLITSINRRFVNIDSQKNSGVDFLVSYNREFTPFSLGVDVQGTYQLKDEITRMIGGVVDRDNRRGLPNEPNFSGSIDVVASRNAWTFYYGLIAIGSSGLTEFYNGDTFAFGNGYNLDLIREELETGFTVYHTLSVGRRFKNGFQATFGVNNVLDADPPIVSRDWKFDGLRTGVAAQNSWDLRGRRIFLKVRKSL